MFKLWSINNIYTYIYMDYEINELILNNNLKKLKELINTKKLSIHKSMFSKKKKIFSLCF